MLEDPVAAWKFIERAEWKMDPPSPVRGPFEVTIMLHDGTPVGSSLYDSTPPEGA